MTMAMTETLERSQQDAQLSKKSEHIDGYGNTFKLPDITIKQIRDAIPAHCYERSAIRSLSYVVRDITLVSLTFYVFNTYNQPALVPSFALRSALWTLYGFIQGLFCFGIWILAHECGHQSFSPSRLLNDTVGWVLHSALLVPYFSWKFSHRQHHASTGHMERDMAFVPRTRAQYVESFGSRIHELTEETPIMTALALMMRQLIGWPIYLMNNFTGHNNHQRRTDKRGEGKSNGLMGGVNHFSPTSPIFDARDGKYILLSDVGLGIVAFVLYQVAQNHGWANVFVWYGVPYLWVNHWLVATTYLQHTDPSLPHYGSKAWNFARGAAATIDRDFGFVGRHLFHHIIDTHVLHHYVSTIPFYHSEEATEAIKKVMGEHYRSDTSGGYMGFLKSLWTTARWCQWVEPSANGDKDVMFFRNRNGLGAKPLQMM